MRSKFARLPQPGSFAQRRQHAPQCAKVDVAANADVPTIAQLDFDEPEVGVDRIGGAESEAGLDGTDTVGVVSIICTGMNIAMSDAAVSTPSRTCRRQVNRRLSQTSWRAATARIATPGSRVSATMRNLSAVLQRRRPSRPVMISITPSIDTPQVPPKVAT